MTSSQQEFWKWFREHEGEFFDFEADQEKRFDRLASRLKEVDPNLSFEFGPKRNGKREFVISAGGIKQAFPAVVALVSAAPKLDRWQVTAFRPRRASLNEVEFRGKRVRPSDVQFTLLDDGQRAGLYLFVPGYGDDDADLKQIGYLLLDDALGEYDVESKLGLIKMFSPEARTAGERYPLTELPRLLDELVSQLASQSRN